MADGVNLMDLAMRISVDAKGVDSGLTATQQKVLALAKEFEKTEAAAKKAASTMASGGASLINTFKQQEQAAQKAATSIGTDLQGAIAGLSEAAGPIGMIAGALLAVAGAAVAVGAEFYSLVKSTADFEGKLYDLSQQTGVSVELLSTLGTLAATTGSDIGAVSASLGIFQKHLEAASDPADKMAKKLKELHISTKDTETALKDSFKVLSQMPEGYKQTALALELFGRGGKALLAMLKESHGDIDGAMAKFKELGIVVGTDNAKAADAFNDAYELLTRQLRGTTATIVQDSIPTFTRFFNILSEDGPKGGKGMSVLAGLVNAAVTSILSDLLGAAYGVTTFVNQMSQAGSNLANGQFIWALRDMVGMLRTVGKAASGGFKADALSSLGPVGNIGDVGEGMFNPRVRAGGGGGGGGGKRGGGGSDPAVTMQRLAAISLKIALDNIKEEQAANERFLKLKLSSYVNYYDSADFLEAKYHQKVLAGLAAESAAAEKIKKGDQQRLALATIEQKYNEEKIRHAQAEEKITDHVLTLTRARIVLTETLINRQRELTRQRQVEVQSYDDQRKKYLRDTFGYYGPEYMGQGQSAPESPADATRPRRVSDPADQMGLRIKLMNDRLKQFSQDVTGVLSNAIRVGFEQGAAAGFKSLLQGFLDMLAKMAEQMIASSIFKMLQSLMDPNSASGSGGGNGSGGIWASLGALLKGFLGSGGGSGGGFPSGFPSPAIGGFAKGLPYVPYDNFPAMLHKGERVLTAAENRGGGGGNTFIVQINVPNIAAAGTGATRHQVAKQLHGMMEGVALMG